MAKVKSASPGAPKKPRKATVPAAIPTYDEIALRAYHIYLQRGAMSGDPTQDWLQAEQELLAAVALKKPGRKSKIVSIAA